MTEHETINDDDSIDLRKLFYVLNKWKKIIALITIVSVITSGILSYFVLDPVYESKSLLLATRTADKERVVNSNDNLEALISNISRIPQLTINTYVNQLKSEIVFQGVANKLNLDPKVYTPGALSGISAATALKDSNLIELTVKHNDPHMAAKINSAITDSYLELISEKNQTQMTRSVGFLDDQRQKVEKELDQVLQATKAFESQPGGVAFLEQQFTTKNQDLSKYQSMMNEARVEFKQAEAGVERVSEEMEKVSRTVAVKKTEGSVQNTAVEPNPLYVALTQEYVNKTTRVSELSAKIQMMEAIISEVRQDVDRIQRDLVERKSEREKLEDQKKRLVNARNLLAEKVTQTQIAKSIDLGETSIVLVSPAMIPNSPIKPNKKLNMAIAFILGLMIAVFISFLMEYMDNTIKEPKEVAEKLNVPLLGMIPYVNGRR